MEVRWCLLAYSGHLAMALGRDHEVANREAMLDERMSRNCIEASNGASKNDNHHECTSCA